MNADELLIAIKDLENDLKIDNRNRSTSPYFPFEPRKLMGLDVHTIEPQMVPVVQVREDFEWLTDEARERINKRLIELLGYKDISPLRRNEAYLFGNNVVMHRDAVKLINVSA